MVSGYFVKNKMSKDNKIYSNLNTKKKTLHRCQEKRRKVDN